MSRSDLVEVSLGNLREHRDAAARWPDRPAGPSGADV